jgi:hypothetical protein
VSVELHMYRMQWLIRLRYTFLCGGLVCTDLFGYVAKCVSVWLCCQVRICLVMLPSAYLSGYVAKCVSVWLCCQVRIGAYQPST